MKVGHFEDGSKFSLFETQLSKVKSPKRGCRFKSWVGNVYSTCHIPTRIHLQCLLLIHYSNFSYYCPNSKVWKCLQMLSLESKIRPSFASFQISCRGRKKEGVKSLREGSFGLLNKKVVPPLPLAHLWLHIVYKLACELCGRSTSSWFSFHSIPLRHLPRLVRCTQRC